MVGPGEGRTAGLPGKGPRRPRRRQGFSRQLTGALHHPMSAPMTVLPIITLPDPLLRKSSAPIERIDAEVRKLADDMLETMYAAPGVGLAAVQVGVPRRLIVLDTAKDEEPPQPLVLINPEIVTLGSEMRAARGGVPVDPGCAHRHRAARHADGALPRPRGQAAGAGGRRACWQRPSSTRSTT